MRAVFFLLACCNLFSAPVITVSSKTEKPVNLIRKMLREIPSVNMEREKVGLSSVINLSIGQPHRAMNVCVIDDLITYLEGLKELSSEELALEMGYCHAAGLRETREWVSRAFTHDYPEAKEFTLEEVMVTNGAAGALTNALKVLVEKGDAVAVFSPYFAAYKNQVEDNEADLIAIDIGSKRAFAEKLEAALQAYPEIKVFLWNDPNNPLGTKASKEELEEIAKVLDNHPDLIIIHDEVYRDFTSSSYPISLLNIAPHLKERSIVIRSLAKDTLGAPGLRAGMVAAPTDIETSSGKRVNLIELMANEQLRDIVSVSVLVQKTLVFALQAKLDGRSDEWTESMREEYKKNITIVTSALQKMNLPPLQAAEGAFYVMVNVGSLLGKEFPDEINGIEDLHCKVGKTRLENDQDVASFILHSAGVAMVPGSGFNAKEPSLRISCANREDLLEEAMKRVEAALFYLQ